MCSNRLYMGFWLVFFSLVSVGISWGETTSEKYETLLTELTEIWKEVNSLSISSEMTLIDIQERFPQLLDRVNSFETKLENFEKNLEDTYRNSEALSLNLSQSLMELMALKSQYGELSRSIETLRISFTNIEDSVKRAERRSNAGLVIGIVAGCIVVGLVGFEIYQQFK